MYLKHITQVDLNEFGVIIQIIKHNDFSIRIKERNKGKGDI